MSSPTPQHTPAPLSSAWAGRVDGDGPEHRRWHQAVRPATTADDAGPASPAPGSTPATDSAPATSGTPAPGSTITSESSAPHPGTVRSTAFVGFASDEGVRRNSGRIGAVEGPDALRSALAPLAHVPGTGVLVDAGDVVVTRGDDDAPGDLEEGQAALAGRIAGLLDEHTLTVVLGGGHETAYASYCGLAGSGRVGEGTRVGILNLDAHFDLREAPRPSSGTPFLQALREAAASEHSLAYAVVGVSEATNTQVLFETAREHGVTWISDEHAQTADLSQVLRFVREFTDHVDVLYLTIDLDVLPAAVAPGVSAPAGFGVPYEVVHACVLEATRSGKLALADVVELNPSLDVDGRTAKAAARLIHTIVGRHRPRR
ncbi:formimidoylglutamase [Micrococcus sp.]|uniref:formimidoylglutamase n=1 Tax=Micrococcus sp. TaxID=1271 RepID=UPI002A91FBEA|nr:formimidoylglutamase [Micrococcus sp.]MDY6055861.1 formimidoylglutamase [Micrococcus sp.]